MSSPNAVALTISGRTLVDKVATQFGGTISTNEPKSLQRKRKAVRPVFPSPRTPDPISTNPEVHSSFGHDPLAPLSVSSDKSPEPQDPGNYGCELERPEIVVSNHICACSLLLGMAMPGSWCSGDLSPETETGVNA
ncbi:hypothetical protein RUND412_005042 [Rhizina undulata]